MDSKNVALSKTVIGVVVTLLTPYLAKHGFVFDADGLAAELVTLAGAALAVYGRFTASKSLTVLK